MHAAVAGIINECLQADSRFRNKRWYTAQSWDSSLGCNYDVIVEQNPPHTPHTVNPTAWVIDAETMQVIRTVATGEDPTRIYLAPDQRLFVVNYGERSIRVFDPESLEALGRVDTVAKPIAVSFHPDGRLAYVALNDHSVGVLDLATMTLRQGFPVGKEPDGLAILAL